MPSAPAAAGTLDKPIDPAQQTRLGFGDRSHWLQPWRGYLDTPPATRLRDAIGINFNVEYEEAPATAELLGRSGFTRARVEFGWNQMDYANPTRLTNPALLRHYLTSLKSNGHSAPDPAERQPRDPGAGPLLHRHNAPACAPGQPPDIARPRRARPRWCPARPDLDNLEGARAADVLFTAVDASGWATLSRALPRDLAAGAHRASTLRYAPFGPPLLTNGRPNPLFQETLRGWLAYTSAVTREARKVLGRSFDVEIWNELTFGSDFLYQERYYDPPRESGGGDVTDTIRDATVRYLRSPATGVPGIGISDGFANQRPWASGANVPAGLTAIGKHPYYNLRRFPAGSVFNEITPVDALGGESFTQMGTARRDRFVPRYDAFFPEYSLSGIQTENLVRDISPITTQLYDTPHGRRVAPKGGRPLQTWITEANIDPNSGNLAGADTRHVQAKAALRYFTSFSNKGVAAVHLYGAKGGDLQLIDQSFYDAVGARRGGYPGAQGAGETITAVGRMADAIAGARRLRRTSPLSLERISDRHDHRQFGGDGTRAHPPLYNRDVLGFFPFQVRPREYVAAVYVMTRNMAKAYRRRVGPHALRSATRALRPDHRRPGPATDRGDRNRPDDGPRHPVRVRGLGGGRVRVSMPVTDSPRMLRLVTGGGQANVALKVKRKRLARGGRQVFVGRVRSGRVGCARRMVLAVQRWRGKGRGWKRVRTVSASGARAGVFRASMRNLRRGRYRAHATAAAKGCGHAKSRTVGFRVR